MCEDQEIPVKQREPQEPSNPPIDVPRLQEFRHFLRETEFEHFGRETPGKVLATAPIPDPPKRTQQDS